MYMDEEGEANGTKLSETASPLILFLLMSPSLG